MAGLIRMLVVVAACAAPCGPAGALSYSFAEFDNGTCQPACPSVIVATGTIAGNEDEELAWFLRHSGRGRQVGKLMMIHSPGGNMAGAMRLGAFLRHNKASVMVAQAQGGAVTPAGGIANGLCGSACVFVLAGGVKRIVPPGSVVAVHGAALVQTEIHDPLTGTVTPLRVDRDEAARLMGQYYRRMGVSAKLAAMSEKIPHAEFRVLTPAEMAKLGLARTRF